MLLHHEETEEYEKAFFDSSDISYIKYIKDTREMLVLFKKKYRMYLYENISRDKFLTLKDADSLGRSFREMMRNGRDKELFNVQAIGVLNEEDAKQVERILKGNI